MERSDKEKWLISACLLGMPCRYDGESKPDERILEATANYFFIPICPEQLGGLPTPRTPAERRGGRVVAADGRDVTAAYEQGAEETLKIALEQECRGCILKAKSPSCGCGRIYDGTFTRTLTEGDGVTAELLKENGFLVFTEEDLPF